MKGSRRAYPGRSGGEISGLLVVDKPRGVTSHDVVAAVRGALHLRRVGHAGTLDPMATGVLVIGFGHATRLLNYVVDHHKTYEATIRLGQTTTTDDADGTISSQTPVVLLNSEDAQRVRTDDSGREPMAVTLSLIERTIAEHLTGVIEQVPSAYSAIKVNGKRAYELAREGRDVQLKAREITVDEFVVLDAATVVPASRPAGGIGGFDADTSAISTCEGSVVDVKVRVTCSAGTYIRSLGRDLGDLLGVGGHLTSLRRIRVGRFDVAAANVVSAHVEPHVFTNREGKTVTRNRAVLAEERDELLRKSMSMLEAVKAVMPTVQIDDHEAQDLRYGRRLNLGIGATTAAYIPRTGEVVALLEPTGTDECRSVAVFPAS